MTALEEVNDNGRRFITVICSVCAGPTEPHAAGVEPVCIACLFDESLPCALCGARAESICGQCGDRICGGGECLSIHEHASPEP